VSITDEITQALTSTDSDAGGKGPHAYALEAGMRICAIPEVRAKRVDSAELIGFIRDLATADKACPYDEQAAAIVDRFNLAAPDLMGALKASLVETRKRLDAAANHTEGNPT